VIAIFAIVLMNYRKGGEKAGSRAALIGMLLSCGMGDAMSKIFTESSVAALEGQFLFYTFAVAMVLAVICTKMAKQKIGVREAVFGTLIAVPNFFCSMFILGALETLSAVIVFPVFSVGGILMVTLAGILAFRERLNKQQWIGVCAILAALILLNI
jgi:multidrug transporter EmrE-like cation transporter